jgi:hypothetical protein
MQLSQLSVEGQRVLETASVVGMACSATAVVAGLGQAVELVDDWCALLARRAQWQHMIGERSGPDGTVVSYYCFVYTLYQHVLCHRVLAARRDRLH